MAITWWYILLVALFETTGAKRQDYQPQKNYDQSGRDRPLTVQRLLKNAMQSSFIGCATNISKYHTTNEEIIKVVRMLTMLPYNVLHNDPNNTCVLDCALKKVGLMNSQGGIITDGLFKALVTKVPITQAQDYLVTEYDKCATKTFSGSDPCKTASNFIFCFFVMGSTLIPAMKLARSAPALFNSVQDLWKKIPIINLIKLPTLPTFAPTTNPAPTVASATTTSTAPAGTTTGHKLTFFKRDTTTTPPVTPAVTATTSSAATTMTDKSTQDAVTTPTVTTTTAAATTGATTTTAAATSVASVTTTAATTAAVATTVAPKA